MPWENSFNTNSLFVGGGGMFIEYHDIIRLVDLFLIVRMVLTQEAFGLPIQILDGMGVKAMTEWYLMRSNQNPLYALDYQHIIPPEDLDTLRQNVLDSDPSIYQYAPHTNFYKMMQLMRDQQIQIPVYIWTPTNEPNAEQDLAHLPISTTYLTGPLGQVIPKYCKNNYTYIFSDVEHAKSVSELLTDRFGHVLVPTEFRYNYQGHMKSLKYQIQSPMIRFGQIPMIDYQELGTAFSKLSEEHGGNS